MKNYSEMTRMEMSIMLYLLQEQELTVLWDMGGNPCMCPRQRIALLEVNNLQANKLNTVHFSKVKSLKKKS